jgi:hypothetical protein
VREGGRGGSKEISFFSELDYLSTVFRYKAKPLEQSCSLNKNFPHFFEILTSDSMYVHKKKLFSKSSIFFIS